MTDAILITQQIVYVELWLCHCTGIPDPVSGRWNLSTSHSLPLPCHAHYGVIRTSTEVLPLHHGVGQL